MTDTTVLRAEAALLGEDYDLHGPCEVESVGGRIVSLRPAAASFARSVRGGGTSVMVHLTKAMGLDHGGVPAKGMPALGEFYRGFC